MKLRRWFWKRVALFAWRRWVVGQREPTGVPGRRDPEYPCESYEPRTRLRSDRGSCEGDGHYLCPGCCHHASRIEVEDEVGVAG